MSQPSDGLTLAEVAERRARGQVNDVPATPSRTVAEIVRANVFTRFNALLGSLLVVILIVGPIQDALFGFVLIANAGVGIYQELRAKRTLDRLAVLTSPRARIVRDGRGRRDAGLRRRPRRRARAAAGRPGRRRRRGARGPEPRGGRVAAHRRVRARRQGSPGDEVLSGSFVAAGDGRFRATRVGAGAYAAELAEQARRFTLTRSELRGGIDQHPADRHVAAGADGDPARDQPAALERERARRAPRLGRRHGRDGPRGARAADERRLRGRRGAAGARAGPGPGAAGGRGPRARRRALHRQDGDADRGPARRRGGRDPARGRDAPRGARRARRRRTPTRTRRCSRSARSSRSPPTVGSRATAVPFSSARKWSGAEFGSKGTWVLGAPDVLLPGGSGERELRARARARRGRPARRPARHDGRAARRRGRPPRARSVRVRDPRRPGARDGLADARVLRAPGRRGEGHQRRPPRDRGRGGPARRVCRAPAGRSTRRRSRPTATALAEALETHSIFGRVTPQQKRAMVEALQSRGHVVAMTGDGVNDVLALKDADIGIAMGSGSSATRAVAQLVLLDSSFDALPAVVGEGRRVLGNIERTSNLYVTKTVYAMLIALGVGVVGLRVPVPAAAPHADRGAHDRDPVVLPRARARTDERARPGFLRRVLRFTIPAGTLAAVATFLGYVLARDEPGVTLAEARTTATMVLLWIGFLVLSDHRGAAHDVAARAGLGDAGAVRAGDGRPGGAGVLRARPAAAHRVAGGVRDRGAGVVARPAVPAARAPVGPGAPPAPA